MVGYAQATYDKAVEAFKGQPEDRSAVVNSVTDSYADMLEKAAYESAMLAKSRREAGFSVVPQGWPNSFLVPPAVTTTELPPAPSNVPAPPNMPAFDMRDPMSGLREDDMDMNSAMERFGAGGVKMVGEEELPTVDTSVPAPVASGAGLMTRPQARQGLSSPNTTEQVKAAQSYLGVTSDGVIGKNTRGAIKDFQEKAGLPISGELDAATKQAMQNPDALDPRDRPIATAPVAFMETKTFKLLQGVEGFKSKPYSLNAKALINGKPHRSGLTVGAGIDFGQHTRSALEAIGLPKTMIDKAENAGWIGLNPDTIIDPATGKPAANREVGHRLMFNRFKEQKSTGTLPTFTEEELNAATPVMYKPYEQSARDALDARHGEGTYDSLDEGSKAVLTLEKYHRGTTYKLPNAMLDGAAAGDPLKAASGISWSSRSKNMKDWLSKVGLDVSNAPTTEAALNVAAPSTAATAPPTATARKTGVANKDIRAIQSVVGATVDGVFGPMSRKSSIEYLRKNNVEVPLTVSNSQLMGYVRGVAVEGILPSEIAEKYTSLASSLDPKNVAELNKAIFEAVTFSGTLPTPKKGEDPIKWIAENVLGAKETDPAFRAAMKAVTNVDPKLTPWCAAFAGHVLRGLGATLPGRAIENPNLAFNYSTLGQEVYNHNPKTGKTYAGSLDDVQPGDVIVFSKENRASDGSIGYGKGHISFIVDVEDDGSVIALGGNQGNSVKTSRYTPAVMAKNFKGGFTVRRISDQSLAQTDPATIAAITKDIAVGGAGN
jgi:peptidoglycan hydrolase-like protein with peptidoglycan-binding domain